MVIQWKIMRHTAKKESILKDKFLYTAIIILVYLFGRCIPLYGIKKLQYTERSMDVGNMLIQTVSGDADRCSLFALGISPYMIAMILVQFAVAFRKACDSGGRISPKKINRISLVLTVFFASVQALLRMQELPFCVTEELLPSAKAVSFLEMVTGAVLILWLADRNRKYGFGGQTILIYINILDGITAKLGSYSIKVLTVPLLTAVAVIWIILLMENTEKRIPVQRISIHNIYADKNYLAVKFNTVGAMPVMFSTAFFMLPQMLVTLLAWLFPKNNRIAWWQDNLILTRPLGIGVYILILYLLTIGFAVVMISPGEITQQFLKSGDSIPNIHAGRDTRRYLTREICKISFFSATVMSICLGVPMYLQLRGEADTMLSMFPASAMILTSIWCSLYQEFLAVKSFDAYDPFV